MLKRALEHGCYSQNKVVPEAKRQKGVMKIRANTSASSDSNFQYIPNVLRKNTFTQNNLQAEGHSSKLEVSIDRGSSVQLVHSSDFNKKLQSAQEDSAIHISQSAKPISGISEESYVTSGSDDCEISVIQNDIKKVKTYADYIVKSKRPEDTFQSESNPAENVDNGSDDSNQTGIPLSQVILSQRKFAEVLACNRCGFIPLVPYMSKCSHVLCKFCAENIGSFHDCVGFTNRNRMGFHAHTSHVYKNLINTFTFKCKHACGFKGDVHGVLTHQVECKLEKGESNKNGTEEELKGKVDKFLELGDHYCESRGTSLEFMLFCGLRRLLKRKGDKRKVSLLMHLFADKNCDLGWQLSPEDCLALKVSMGQGHNLYRYHYNFLRKHVSVCNLQSPKQIEKLEKMFYPPFTDFSVESQSGLVFYKKTIKDEVEPTDIGELLSCKGYRWKFTAALAKTLQELSFEFQDRLIHVQNAKFVVDVHDRYERIKNVKFLKLRKKVKMPNYYLRYSFCVLRIVLVEGDQESVVYKSEEPDLIYRPAGLALPCEQTHDSNKLLLHPVEEEKRNLSRKLLCVQLPNGMIGKFCLRLSSVVNYGNTSMDLISIGNFDVNEYGSFCTLCHHDRIYWLSHMGSCTVAEDAKTIATKSCVNPVQFDLNFIKLFNEVVVREMSGVYKSLHDCSDLDKLSLRAALDKMNSLMIHKYEIEPDSLILDPEEYIKKFFSLWSSGKCKLKVSKAKQLDIVGLFMSYAPLRAIYTAVFDKQKQKSVKIKPFKGYALGWIKHVWRKFPYIAPSSYLHMLVEHGEELLMLMRESESHSVENEANALNPKVKEFLVRTLKSQWLRTSPFLNKKKEICYSRAKCNGCGNRSHTSEMCPQK